MVLVEHLETLDHRDKILQPVFGARIELEVDLIDVLHHLKNRTLVMVGGNREFFNGGVADATRRIIDHAHQCLFVFRVKHQTQITQHILDFLALVKRQAAVNAVWDVAFAQCILHGTRLGVGPVQDCKFIVGQMLPDFLFPDGTGHKTAFLAIGDAAVDFDAVARIIGRPDDFIELDFVFIDDGIGRLHDILGRPVILFESVHFYILIILLEVEDVVDVGAAKSINTLRIVAHDTDVLETVRQRPYNQILRMVGVLVLIHQNVTKTVLVFGQDIRETVEQFVGLEQ